MAEGTRMKELDALAKENRSQLQDLQNRFFELSDKVTKDSQAREVAERRVEDWFEELFKLLGKGAQKGKERVMGFSGDSSGVDRVEVINDSDSPFLHQQTRSQFTNKSQGNFLRPPKGTRSQFTDFSLMAEGTIMKELVALTKENRSQLQDLQNRFFELSDKVTKDSQTREVAERRVEDKFEELFKLLDKMAQKGKERVMVNDSDSPFLHQQTRSQFTNESQDDITPKAGSSTWKILTYNVWFREDLEMHKRMRALGDLIEQHSPDVICFQEVTPNIYNIFQQSSWWKAYRCSVSANKRSDARRYFCMQLSKAPVKSFSCRPFSNSIMARELCLTEIEVEGAKTLVVATSHLESPCPAPPKWDQMYSNERVAQAKEALIYLNKTPNVVFCGDMNWDDKLDGQFPLPDGWVDAWAELRPGQDGYTYDTNSNQMLTGNWKVQKRLDRFCCSLQNYKIRGIDIIGTEAIPGLQYCKEKKVKNGVKKLMLPVLPSDHYGLLLTLSRK